MPSLEPAAIMLLSN